MSFYTLFDNFLNIYLVENMYSQCGDGFWPNPPQSGAASLTSLPSVVGLDFGSSFTLTIPCIMLSKC